MEEVFTGDRVVTCSAISLQWADIICSLHLLGDQVTIIANSVVREQVYRWLWQVCSSYFYKKGAPWNFTKSNWPPESTFGGSLSFPGMSNLTKVQIEKFRNFRIPPRFGFESFESVNVFKSLSWKISNVFTDRFKTSNISNFFSIQVWQIRRFKIFRGTSLKSSILSSKPPNFTDRDQNLQLKLCFYKII